MRERDVERKPSKLILPFDDPFVQAFDQALLRREVESHKPTLPLTDQERFACRLAMFEYGEALRNHYTLDAEDLYLPQWMEIPLEQWKHVPPAERHRLIEQDRADYLSNAWKEHLEAIPPGECLDLGCGSGFFLGNMHKKDGHTWHGLDLPNEKLSYRKTLKNFREGSCLELPEEWTNTFSGVTLHSVAHHIAPQDRIKFLQELYRVTKPGAHILVTEEMALELKLKPKDPTGIKSHKGNVIDAMLDIVDNIFYPRGKGDPYSGLDWQVLFDQQGFSTVFSGDNGVYNSAGIPIPECYFVFERRPEEQKHMLACDYWSRNLQDYGLDKEE